jgi:malonate transporter and related proteins
MLLVYFIGQTNVKLDNILGGEMSIVLNSLLPILGLMGLGAVSKKFNILGDNSEKIISRFVLYFSLPAILFISVGEAPIGDLLNKNFLTAIIIVLVIFYLGIFAICLLFRKNIQTSSMHSLGISFPNTAFMGIPVLMSLFGEKSLIPLAVVNLLTLFMFCGTVLLLELTDSNQSRNGKNIYSKVLKTMISQPVLIAILGGIAMSMCHFEVPKPVSNFCHQLGMTAGPCAMFILGERVLNLKFGSVLKRNIRFGIVAKLILMPLIAVILLLVLNVNPLWASSGLVLMALPSAGSTYMLAVEKNICITESSELIIISTVVSFLSLSVIILALPYLWPTVQFVA